jgi:hypothetical protein
MKILLALALAFWPEGTQKRNPYASWAWEQAWHEEDGAARWGSH